MMNKEDLFQFIDEHQSDMIDFWRQLVNTESYSGNKDGVNAVQAIIKSKLESMGGKVRLVPFEKAGSTLIAEFDGVDEAPLLLGGHCDTVFPTGAVAERPFTIDDQGLAHGPGVLDMKGGITILVFAIAALRSAGFNKRPIKVVIVGDEEPGHPFSNAREVLVEEAKGAVAAFNFETAFPDNGLVVGRNGTAEFHMNVYGVASHRGNDPENGRSAILEIAHKCIEIDALTDLAHGISCTVGNIQGGTVVNATPGFATCGIDIRGKDPAAIDVVIEQVKAIAGKTFVDGTRTELEGGHLYKPMVTTDGVKKLFELVKETSIENGFPTPYPKFCGGGSDAAYLVYAGVPTVCGMGVKGLRNHSPEEHAIVDALFERAKLVAACALKI